MKKRCLLSIKFGHDVAHMISQLVWRGKIRNVNSEYHERITFDKHDCDVLMKPAEFFFNYRTIDDYLYDQGYVYNMNLPAHHRQVAQRPKNYWHIKELY